MIAGGLHAPLRRLRFAHIGTRLAVLYAGLFAAAMLAVGGTAQWMIERHAQASVRTELASSGSVFDRLWSLRASSLDASAAVLARDFGFRSAVASGDEATIRSALANLERRVQVPHAFVVTQDGAVIGEGEAALRAAAAGLPYRLPAGRHDAVVATGAGVFRFVVSPILAPTEIGWVVFAVPLDGGEMRALEQLSAIPLSATMLRRDGGHWHPATAGAAFAPGALDRFMATDSAATDIPALLKTGYGHAVALARPLPSAPGEQPAVLLLSFPLAQALAPYRTLQIGIVLIGLCGLVGVLGGSRLLAASIARPIVALDAAARTLEEGDRVEVAVDGHDEIARLAASFNRMSAGIVEREARITHLAFHDALTGLPNRLLFHQQLHAALARSGRLGERVAVLCLDLDGFKAINDSYGQATGDALLRAVAAMLGELADDGLCARLSGDEFAILLAGIAADRPRALAQAILDGLRQPIPIEARQVPAGASIGIAVAPGDGSDAASLLKAADLALLRAKQEGRAMFRFFEPALDAAARARRQLELDLREAVRSGAFRLDYQPLYHVRGDGIAGFEALMRWDHPERGPISPAEFIPVAEECGLIVAMGEWALHEACREARLWPDDLRVAVNVSPIQFRNPGFGAVLMQALARSGLPPERLEIEITESVFLEGAETTLETLHRLRGLGVRIALDDFGTGYSSLSYLRSFPFDKIKIDRSFIMGIAEDRGAAAIVHAIVDLATALEMDTTAEGVEDERQLAALRAQGCGTVQGFLFSRPLRAAAVHDLLAQEASAIRARA